MRKLPTLLLFIIVFISGCATTGTKTSAQPDWVDGKSKRYPNELYLTGQGMAGNLDAAKDRARADLAKQFEVAINQRSLEQQEFRRQQQGDESSESLKQNISRQLITQTTRTIQGVEIADTWHEPSSKQHHAFAVLSRNKAKQHFAQLIKEYDEQSGQKLQQAEAETSNLRKAALVQQSINAQLQRVGAQSAMQIVDPSGRGIPPELSLAELIRSRDTLIKRVVLRIESSGTQAEGLQPLLSGNAATAGFQISSNEKFDYTLVGETKLEQPIKEKGWYWLRGVLEIKLLDPDLNEAGIKRWPLKAASVTIDQADQRLLNDIDEILKEELRDTLLGFVSTN